MVVEVVRKMIELVSMVSVIWAPVPAALRVAHWPDVYGGAAGLVDELGAAVQAIATAIPPAGGVVPHATPD